MRENSPLITVLMAVYNTPSDYLDAAIESLLAQTFRDFELLIVDDGSDEPTLMHLQLQAKCDSRIVVHRLKENLGLTRALNVGLERARGVYIARHDADDVSSPERLERTLAFLVRDPRLSAAGTLVSVIDSAGCPVGSMRCESELSRLKRRNTLVHGSMMFRKTALERVGRYDERMRFSQDYELYLRMMRYFGMCIGVVPETLYALRQHSESLSSRHIFRQFHYAVLAKTFTSPVRGLWSRRFWFASTFAFDLLITHRLMLGPVLQRLLSGSSSCQPAVTNNTSNFKEITACRLCGNRNLVEDHRSRASVLDRRVPEEAE